jgi:ABC-type nitrate/sulfonate/bicarbonate transport system substrate-binding protein
MQNTLKSLTAGIVLCAASTSGYAEELTLQLKWVTQAQFAGYYVALDKGFYEAQGIDMTIKPGGPDIAPAQVLAGGGADIVVDWLPSALATREKGLPLVNIAQIYDQSGMMLTCLKSSGVETPKDFSGKTLGVWFFGNEYPFLSWMSKLGYPTDGGESGVTVLKQGFNVDPIFNGQADCVSTMTYNEYGQVLDGGLTPAELTLFKYEEEGVATLEDGLYVLEDTLKDPAKQEAYAKFLKATIQGWEWAKENPNHITMMGAMPTIGMADMKLPSGKSAFCKNRLFTTHMAEKVKTYLAGFPTLFDIADNLSDGKEELRVDLKLQAYALGLTRSDVIRQVRQNFFGIEVQRVQRGRNEVSVMVRLPEDERISIDNLRSILITTDTGQVPLDEVASLTPAQGASAIYRIDQMRTVSVTSDMDKVNTNSTVLNRNLQEFLDQLMLQYPGADYTLEGEAREQQESFDSLKLGLAFTFFAIYGLLAIPFRSYSQPLIVMSVIPFGAVGALAGHWLMGMDLTIMSLLGLLALIGVIVNDSLVLVEYCNRKQQAITIDQDRHAMVMEAVEQAGVARFRPVLLTSMTTFLGLMPLLFEKAVQAQFLIPMAVSLGFGILFGTVITLLMVPVNIMLLEDVKRFFKRIA